MPLVAAYTGIYLVWGSTYLAVRVGLETMPPFGMLAVRFLVAGSLLYAWARARGAPRPTRDEWKAAALLGLFLVGFGGGALAWAEQRVTSSVAALLVATEPLWIVLLAWRRPGGTRPTPRVLVGLGLGLVGVAVLVASPTGPSAAGAPAGYGPDAGARAVDPLGAAVVLFGAVAWAVGALWPGRARLAASAPLATAMQMLVGSALFAAASVLSGEPLGAAAATVSLRSVAALAYLVVFGSLCGFTSFVWLMAVEPPARVATYAFVNPVVAVLLGCVLADEPVGWPLLVGGPIIVGAVILLVATARGPRTRDA